MHFDSSETGKSPENLRSPGSYHHHEHRCSNELVIPFDLELVLVVWDSVYEPDVTVLEPIFDCDAPVVARSEFPSIIKRDNSHAVYAIYS